MARGYYDLGINGQEVKRRLDLLKNIFGEGEDADIANKAYVKEQISEALNEEKIQQYYNLDAGALKDAWMVDPEEDTEEGQGEGPEEV